MYNENSLLEFMKTVINKIDFVMLTSQLATCVTGFGKTDHTDMPIVSRNIHSHPISNDRCLVLALVIKHVISI